MDELTPEQRRQLQEGLARAREALRSLSGGGLLRAAGRRMVRRAVPRWRFRRRRLAALAVALLVAGLSLTTCSAGFDLAGLTAEYGGPVRATPDAARRFVERAAAAIEGAPANRRVTIAVSDEEATSALSLGLMMPDLGRAMRALPPEAVRDAQDLEALRERLQAQEAAARDTLGFAERIAAAVDPRLRTSDVQVRFTAAGEIVMAAYVHAWRWKQPALVVFAPRARSGELELDFVKGRLGWLPAPAWAFDLLGRLAASLVLQGRAYAEISTLTVEEGRLAFEAALTR